MRLGIDLRENLRLHACARPPSKRIKRQARACHDRAPALRAPNRISVSWDVGRAPDIVAGGRRTSCPAEAPNGIVHRGVHAFLIKTHLLLRLNSAAAVPSHGQSQNRSSPEVSAWRRSNNGSVTLQTWCRSRINCHENVHLGTNQCSYAAGVSTFYIG